MADNEKASKVGKVTTPAAKRAKTMLVTQYVEKQQPENYHEESPQSYASEQVESAEKRVAQTGADGMRYTMTWKGHHRSHNSERASHGKTRTEWETPTPDSTTCRESGLGREQPIDIPKRQVEQGRRYAQKSLLTAKKNEKKQLDREFIRSEEKKPMFQTEHGPHSLYRGSKSKQVPAARNNLIQTNYRKQVDHITRQRPAMISAARSRFQIKAQRELFQQGMESSRKTIRASGQVASEITKITAKAIGKAISSLSFSVVSLILLVLCLVTIAVGGISASPFGILFAGESAGPDAVPVSIAAARVNFAFNEVLENLQEGDYDSITMAGEPADWVDILAIYAIHTAGKNTPDAADVVTLDGHRIDLLKSVFYDMNPITTEVEEISHGDSTPDDGVDQSWTERILHITITPKTIEEMTDMYHFSGEQHAMLSELLEYREQLQELVGDLVYRSAEAQRVLRELPEDMSAERRAVVETACSLVGKVGYFWGGKSLVMGWDNRWGRPSEVTAAGSPTTGTYRPYGLDCSGFVDWVFYNATGGELILGQGGGARMQHHACTPISWAEALPGDLVFYPDDTHVGIVCGRDDSGDPLIVHCASGANDVVITGKNGFVSPAMPDCFG